MNNPVISQVSDGASDLAVYAYRIDDFTGKPVGVLEIAMDRSHYSAAINNARNVATVVGIVSLVVGLLIAAFIARLIVMPLNQAVDAMNEIAEGEGDLTRRLDDEGDNEISRLATAFNKFAEKVRLMVSQVYGINPRQLASAAEEMSAITEETNRGTQQQQSETSQVVTAMNEMTATVQEVARHATDAADAANNADMAAIER